MSGGYAGKIARINLSNLSVTTINTSDYETWVGGHGMGSAIFYDIMVEEKGLDLSAIDGFDPECALTVMGSPVSGTIVPAAPGRCEMQGIGVQSSPIGWFTRSNFGGRFAPNLKFAGWDGIVIEGKADQPVWIDIRDGDIQIRNCSEISLWGTDAWESQQTIWDYVSGYSGFGDWYEPDGADGQTTQRPAVLAIAKSGENLCRTACLMHDAGNGAGQGGFGAVFGAKNLKAVSVIGTGELEIADPNALVEARLDQKENYQFDQYDLKNSGTGISHDNAPSATGGRGGQRPQACMGCYSGCRHRYEDGFTNESQCIEGMLAAGGDHPEEIPDIVNRYGINAYEIIRGVPYLRDLYEMGVLGPGKEIDCGDLDFEDYASSEFYERLYEMMTNREGDFGDAIAEGFYRAADRWGRLEEDIANEILPFSYWGLPEHGYDPRAELEWGYGSILGERDINEHGFNDLYWDPTYNAIAGIPIKATAEENVKIRTDKMEPYEGDMLMLDYSTENMYSEHIAKLVAWQRHYTRFWKQSVQYCDWKWPDFVNAYAPGQIGSTGIAEQKFFNAVTGKNFTFADGMELGRKIWNLDHAIWTLQGRHRDIVHFAEYVYTVPYSGWFTPMYQMPGLENGEWKYIELTGRIMDRDKFEEFKTLFYTLEGWNTETGYPNKVTLEGLGLRYVATALAAVDKLGDADVVLAPECDFTYDKTTGQGTCTTKFTSTSLYSPTSWAWDFGDGNTSTEENPTHTYTAGGKYTVSLTVTNDVGTDTETKTDLITVNAGQAPSADFDAAAFTNKYGNVTVNFVDKSTNNPTSWAWDFGDGNTSTAQNPSHTYKKAGSYTVSLEVSNASGSDKKVKANLVTTTGDSRDDGDSSTCFINTAAR
ncbi:aldehyde ferredoxin oxidoreductase N-terminal domain-containing protein [Thermodesulfobacteriota bacterium]